MNYWPADQTGLGGLQQELWNYMVLTWAPRGAETAELLYDAPGWVVHNEMNIFGHTGMKQGDDISMYSAKNEPFQIDANFGFVGAVLSMLAVDLPPAAGNDGIRTVVLGPAIPAAWGGGSVKGLRLRGGSAVDFSFDKDGLVTEATMTQQGNAVKVFNKEGSLLCG